MRALLSLCFAACSLALSGCDVVYSAHPLYKDDDAIEEPEILGEWLIDGSNEMEVCVQKSVDHSYEMILFDPKSKLTEIYMINLVRLNDLLYADMIFKEMAVDRSQIEAPLGTITNHVVLKLNLTENDLAYSTLNARAIQARNQEGYYPPLNFVDSQDVPLLITPTDELRQFLSLYSDKVFYDPDHFTRKPTYQTGDNLTTTCSTPTPP